MLEDLVEDAVDARRAATSHLEDAQHRPPRGAWGIGQRANEMPAALNVAIQEGACTGGPGRLR
eukprot:6791145-Alexandrium_andersonii.AAC.1